MLAADDPITRRRYQQIYICNAWKKRGRSNVGVVSITSRKGSPSQKGCVVNGQMLKASNKSVPPPRPALVNINLGGV